MPLVTAQQFQAPSVLSSVQQGLASRGEIQRQGMLSREEANRQRLSELAAAQEAEQRGLLQKARGVEGVTPEEASPEQALNLFFANNREEGEKLFKRLDIETTQQKEDLAAFSDSMIKAPDESSKQFLIDERIRKITARGGDPSETLLLKDAGKPGKMTLEQRDTAMQASKAAALTALQREELGLKQEGLELKKQSLAQNVKKLDAELKQSVKKGDETKFDQEGKLRKNYTDASKEFIKSRDANDRILASLEDPSAAGDLALVFNFMKLLDPGSTVREGEFANAQNSGGVSDITRAKYNGIISGERLSTNIRKDFETRSKKLFSKAESTQNKTVSEYSRLSEKYNLDPENVIIDLTSTPQDQGDLSVAEQAELEELRKRFK